MEVDFSGYATKAGLKCSDGRTITPEAFKHMDGMQVPLVWAHGHNSSDNVLGHVKLEAREDGMYCYGYFNDTPQGKNAKLMVQHKDLDQLSIYANQLVEKLIGKSKQVLHGMIREVSLVLAGANPGAKIDFVAIQHSDGEIENLEDEAVIYTGLSLEHAGSAASTSGDGPTVREIYDSFTQEQKTVVAYMIGTALEEAGASAAQSAVGTEENTEGSAEGAAPATENTTPEGDLAHQEGTTVVTNVFEQNGKQSAGEVHVLTHDAIKGILSDAQEMKSFKSAVQKYALQHGITNISVLFPDAKTLQDRPEFIKRRTEWVEGVLGGTRHTPFSRVKTVLADLTQDEARAKGYVKGNLKTEEWFSVSKRTTGPTTIYKKQKLDRDDIIDIEDFDVVSWMQFEMDLMIREELARAILIGDGRSGGDPDKVADPLGVSSGDGIRSIVNDHELYVTTVNVNISDTNSSYYEVVEELIRARRFYRGTGTPTLYTTLPILTEMLLTKDGEGHRYWKNKAELASDLMVADIVTVEPMEDSVAYPDLLGIIVNLQDYNIGTSKGGQLTTFDDFDIDYNQYKYLIETRLSGALVKYKSALVIKKTASTNVLVNPITEPTFVKATGVVTIPTQTGVVYKNADTSATLTSGAQSALASGATLNVKAFPASGYYFESNAEDEWSFTRP